MSKAETREETAKSGSKEVILMALCGMSPGVITETVWALAKEKPSLLVDRVVALTTNKGAECIREELIESGVWKKLRKALNVGKKQLRFGDTPNSIRIMTAQDESRCLDDINTVEASAAAGDFILENIRQISMNPDQRLIFSLAGGRKTMSALSALCMTLLARPEDRLCHVLVQPPYDSPRLQPKFYFPESAAIHLNGDEEVRGDDSDVRLHDIPFVRCRSLFPQKFGDYAGSYSNLVGLVNEKLAPLELQLHSEPLHASMDGRSVSLTE
jgi:CRISPR-associated protein (TIGR02584 family)